MGLRVIRLCGTLRIALALLLAGSTIVLGCGSGGGSGDGDAGGRDGSTGRRAWIESDPVSPGGTTQARLMISNSTGVAGLDLDLTFNGSSISVLDVDSSPLTGAFVIAYNSSAPESLAVSMSHRAGLASGTGTGELLRMTFAADSSVPSGTRLPLSVASLRVYDGSPAQMRLTRVDGGEIHVQ
jgi:hypothetical protein